MILRSGRQLRMAAPSNELVQQADHDYKQADNDSSYNVGHEDISRRWLQPDQADKTGDLPFTSTEKPSSSQQTMPWWQHGQWQTQYDNTFADLTQSGPPKAAPQETTQLLLTTSAQLGPNLSAPSDQGKACWDNEDRGLLSSPVSVSDIALMVQPFTGVANVEQNADKWLHSFETYTTFKNIHGRTKINLFKLMLTNQAAAWLMALPQHTVCSWNSLVTAFKQRYGLTEAEKWRYQKDIWSREQGETETVDDYVTATQLTANKVGMPQETLREAIIQGLKPELRLFVLNANTHDIPSLLTVARTCEAARSADRPKNCDNLEIKSMVASLMQQMQQMATSMNAADKTEKRVSFAQSVLADSHKTFQQEVDTTQRSRSPDSVQRSVPATHTQRSPSPVAQQQSMVRATRPSDERSQERRSWNSVDNWRQPSTRRPGPQWQSYTPDRRRTTVAPSYNTQNAQMWTSTQQTYGNCPYCGRRHAYGRSFCRAANVQCFNCSRVGHLAKMCRRPVTTQNGVFTGENH